MSREGALGAAVLTGFAGFAIWAHLTGQPFLITLATKAAILALAGVGLNLALGQGGMVSLGHAAFFGAGGYAMGILASHAQAFEPILSAPFVIEGTKSMPVIWAAAMAASGLLALAIGAISLRTSGAYFIMITLAFGQMIFFFAIAFPAYGGEDGLSIWVRNDFPGLNTLVPIQFFALAFAALLAGLAASWWTARSPFGLTLAVARQSPERVETVGVSPYRVKLWAFAISGAITGLAGALFADLNRFVSPSMLSWQTSGEIMVLVIIGGVGRLMGPVVGAATFIALEHLLGGAWDYWLGGLGALLLLIVLFARGGIVGTLVGRPAHG
ncbi:MAG: branched-chain amino acid ABC transporter permease [Paracoccaceae bacterium]